MIACTIDLYCLQPTKYDHVKVDEMHGEKLFNATGGRTVSLSDFVSSKSNVNITGRFAGCNMQQ